MTFVKEFERQYIPKNFKPTDWESLKPYADDLLTREWQSVNDYQAWLEDWDELNIVMSEKGSWLYIHTSVDTENKQAEEAYNDWIGKVETEKSVVENKLNKRMVSSPFNDEVAMRDEGFSLTLKRVCGEIDLFREANVPLIAKDQELSLEFGKTTGAMSVVIDGEEKTMEAAGAILEGPDRSKREEAWKKTAERRYQDKDKMDDVFERLVKIRHQIALNAGEKNYRDYKFKEYQRFDYTAQDCFDFHESIETAVLPIAKRMMQQRQQSMGLNILRPWDLECDPLGRPAIVAFRDSAELITKGIQVLDGTAPFAADTLRRMQEKGLLDLDARKGKATNGYNMSLMETRSAFMFTNQVGKVDDLITFLHEGGHATHDLLCSSLNDYSYQNYPIEIAEVASMSMELLTQDQWNIFMPDEEECARAKYDHLERIVNFLPYMAKVDAFQHAIYENPDLSKEKRHDVWEGLNKRFSYADVDMSGINPDYERTAWQKKMHIYEVPLYYVEYGIAQLGALQIWRNSKQDKKQAIGQYKNALSLGYSKPLPKLFETAGVKFDFSKNMVTDLMGFVGEEMDKLAPLAFKPKPV